MPSLSDVPGIDETTVDLFREAGVRSAESFIEMEVEEVLRRLAEAQASAGIKVPPPTVRAVCTWQNSARSLLRRVTGADILPVAVEIPTGELAAAGVELESLPEARLLRERVKEKQPVTHRRVVSTGEAKAPAGTAEGEPGEDRPRRAGGGEAGRRQAGREPARESARAGRTDGPSEGGLPVSQKRIEKIEIAEKSSEAGEREGENQFRPLQTVQETRPQGERRNRGMSHPDARRVRVAAFVTMMSLLAVVGTALTLLWVVVTAVIYEREHEWWIALLVLVFPVSLLLYLIIGCRVRCRLCGQRLFVPKHCLKHERARRSIFGYTFAVARDAALFGGYRCMLCGTKTRLRD